MLPELDVPVCAALGELPRTWPKSAPSGDVAPMLGRVDVVAVCAAPSVTATGCKTPIIAVASSVRVPERMRARALDSWSAATEASRSSLG
jgi:hypothetical protein